MYGSLSRDNSRYVCSCVCPVPHTAPISQPADRRDKHDQILGWMSKRKGRINWPIFTEKQLQAVIISLPKIEIAEDNNKRKCLRDSVKQ